MIQFKRRQKGFSLVEMAIVLVIVGLLIGGGFSTLGAYLDNAKQSHTKGSLENTKKAILNYVKVNYYMPCPDTDNDGNENRAPDKTCSSAVGTIPFNSIGLGTAIASDDYGNVFAYGVDTSVTMATSMPNKDLSASYFSNVMNSAGQFPAFRLETPPTSSIPDVVTSYTVCKKTAAACDATASNVEVNSIPAIIVAFNENGAMTALDSCNAETGAEAENCNSNSNLFVWKKSFSDGAYDDQLVTISGYEIKEQVLDLLSEISLTFNDSAYDDYDYIINKDLTSTNDFNSASGDAGVDVDGDGSFEEDGDSYGDSLYVTGDVQSNINMQSGSNKLHVEGHVSAVVNGGSDVDVFIIEGSVDSDGSFKLEDGADTLTIGGDVTGDINAGGGDDVIVIEKNLYGTIYMGTGSDDLTINGNIYSAVYGGVKNGQKGSDNDIIRVNKTRAEFITSGQESYLNEFTEIYFTDTGPENLPLIVP